MTKAQKYLKKIHKIDELIRCKIQQQNDIRQMKITATWSDMPSGGSTGTDKIGNIIARIDELENDANNNIDELIELKMDAINKINLLNNNDYIILLNLRYINNMTWCKIAEQLHYDERTLYRQHNNALKQLDIVLSTCQ